MSAPRGPAPPAGIRLFITKAISSAHWFMVAMMARLSPPEMSGITIASARIPSCGSWNMTDWSVLPVGKRSGIRAENSATRATRRTRRPDRPPGAPARSERTKPARPASGEERGAAERSGMGGRLSLGGVPEPATPGPAREHRDRGRGQDDDADDDLEEVGRHAEQVEAVLQHPEQQDAEEHARHRADAAVQARPAEHRRGQHVELAADHRVRHALADAVGLDQAR